MKRFNPSMMAIFAGFITGGLSGLPCPGVAWGATGDTLDVQLDISDVSEADVKLFPCNAGLAHPPVGTAVVGCHYQGSGAGCIPGACQDESCRAQGPCVCSSGNGMGDYFQASYIDADLTWSSDQEGTVLAGRSQPASLFSSYDTALTRQLTSLQFHFGSEMFGNSSFVDVCYQAPELHLQDPEQVLCHNKQETILVAASAVPTHLQLHGDTLGFCPGDELTETLVCHIPKGNPANMQTILIAMSGLNGHLQHHKEGDSDLIGQACPRVARLVTHLSARIRLTERNREYPYAPNAGFQVAGDVLCKTKAGIVLNGARTSFTPLYTEDTDLEVIPESELERLVSLNDPIDSCRIRFSMREASGKVRAWRSHPAALTLFAEGWIEPRY